MHFIDVVCSLIGAQDLTGEYWPLVVFVRPLLCSVRFVVSSDDIMIPQYGPRAWLKLLQKGYMVKKPTEGRQIVEFTTIQLRHSQYNHVFISVFLMQL